MRYETIDDLRAQLAIAKKNKDSSTIASIFLYRLRSRFITPALFIPRQDRHGFLYVSISCQTIESYIAFVKGLKSTHTKSEQCFRDFFDLHKLDLLSNLTPTEADEISSKFYFAVRCGLLHEVEIRGKWRIVRRGKFTFEYEQGKIIINGTRLLNKIDKYIQDHANKIQKNGWDSQETTFAIKKIEAIIAIST